MDSKGTTERKSAPAPHKGPAATPSPSQLPPSTSAQPRGVNFAPVATPGQPAAAADPAMAGFQNNKRFIGLWSANQPLTAWVYVDGIGWKQLADNSDVVNLAMSIVAGHAEAGARTVSYNEDGSGRVVELYVF